ncbi:MAG: VWA domain-containing protein [Pseudomonadota bacterium]
MSPQERWHQSALAAALALLSPSQFHGIRLISPAGPVRTAWLEALSELADYKFAPVHVPASISSRRLTGGVSMAKSLASGVLTEELGLLETARGGLLIVNMAERLDQQNAALIASAIDEQDSQNTAPFCVILLDEGESLDEVPPAVLRERLGFQIDLRGLSHREIEPFLMKPREISAARDELNAVTINEPQLEAVIATCAKIGARSMRAPLFCVHAAKGIAALNGHKEVTTEDLTQACLLVLPQLINSGQPQEPDTPPPPPDDNPQPQNNSEPDKDGTTNEPDLEDLETILVDAINARAELDVGQKRRGRLDRKAKGAGGRSGDLVQAFDKGRPDRASRTRGGNTRVDLIATLRAAAPMQALRQRGKPRQGLQVRSSDIRTKRFRRRKQSSVIFLVDASGSSALYRLAEAKGAVTQLLSDCYSRRDLVSVITFRGTEAETALSPTRSLVRARRLLSDLPGGGATPLASALAAAARLVDAELGKGRSPILVLLSDGKGNVSLEGNADRARAAEQASTLARMLKQMEIPSLFFDISKRSDLRAKALSVDLGAQYHFLPVADAAKVSKLVQKEIGR